MFMMFNRALIFLIFVFSFSSISAQTARPDFNRKQTYDAQHYKIQTSFNHAKREIYGDTTITLKPLAVNFTSVEFDAAGLAFKKVTLDPSGMELKYRTAGDRVIVTLDKAYAPADTVSVRLIYTATRPKKGVYFNDLLTEDGQEVHPAQIYTQGEPDEHRHWFPSFDFPSDKATTEQIITTEKSNTVIANGELLSQKENADGTMTWHYKMPVPHAVYLVSFIIGKYAKVEEKYRDISLSYYVYPGREDIVPKAYGNTKEMMQVFEDLTGVAYPFNKYDQTMVSAFNFGGMENITATTMADTEIFAANVSFLQGNVEDLVSHELAHSWFGNLVTCRNWAELWLNEGFATFMEAAWREKKYGRKDYMRQVLEDANSFMTQDAVLPNSHGLFNRTANNVSALFDHAGVTYNKGGAVVHTLREQIGDEAFWKAINTYLTRHRLGSVESTDLKKAMEETAGQDLTWFFDQWVYGLGYPKLNVTQTWNPRRKILTLIVTQTQKIGGLNTAAYRLPMDVEFVVPNNPVRKEKLEVTKRTQVFTFKLPAKPTSTTFDRDNKIPVKSVKLAVLR